MVRLTRVRQNGTLGETTYSQNKMPLKNWEYNLVRIKKLNFITMHLNSSIFRSEFHFRLFSFLTRVINESQFFFQIQNSKLPLGTNMHSTTWSKENNESNISLQSLASLFFLNISLWCFFPTYLHIPTSLFMKTQLKVGLLGRRGFKKNDLREISQTICQK